MLTDTGHKWKIKMITFRKFCGNKKIYKYKKKGMKSPENKAEEGGVFIYQPRKCRILHCMTWIFLHADFFLVLHHYRRGVVERMRLPLVKHLKLKHGIICQQDFKRCWRLKGFYIDFCQQMCAVAHSWFLLLFRYVIMWNIFESQGIFLLNRLL